MLTTQQHTPIDELENQAKEKLPAHIYDFIAGGAGDEWALRNNRAIWQDYQIMPRALQGITNVDTSLSILNTTLATPVIFAPCAFQKLVCEQGELDSARIAEDMGTIMTLSTMSSCSIEEVAKHSDGTKWFQLYIFKNKKITENIVKRAEDAGYKALVVTVDTPAMGMRWRDIKNQFTLPNGIDAANLRQTEAYSLESQTDGSKIKEHTDNQFETALSWDTIDWLKKITTLPIILKGILHPMDALEATHHHVAAIIISNHGGRQIDSAISPLEALINITEIFDSKALHKKIPLLVDGGIRSGEDIFKALALGAKAVLIGRPVLWSLALGGKTRLLDTVKQLNQELALIMRLAGCNSIQSIHDQGLDIIHNQSLILRKMLRLLNAAPLDNSASPKQQFQSARMFSCSLK